MIRSLIAPTSNALLEGALREKLTRRSTNCGSFGVLEPIAVRLGLLQKTLRPHLRDPYVLVFAGDHGLTVDFAEPPLAGTRELVQQILDGQSPLDLFARVQGMRLLVVDAGIAEPLPRHEHVIVRKIAHGTRNTRLHAAMSIDHAQAAIRAGREIADTLRGNVAAFSGLGIGSDLSAALLLSALSDMPVRDLLLAEREEDDEEVLAYRLLLAQGAQARHRGVSHPIDVLAAYGGFEIAMMVGAMLGAAAKRQLLMVDGIAACAALRVAQCISPAITDYCVFCRSHGGRGLDHAMAIFHASALLELGMETLDGTGAAMSWPLVKAAAGLLAEFAHGEHPTPSTPSGPAGNA